MAGRSSNRRKHGGTAVKIVVTGPFAAGKTTLIRTISEITVLSTETGVTDSTRSRKAETTVAMDFGRITIDRDLVLYLFGTPGQDRFDFMWEILGEGMLGYIVLVDASRQDSLDEAVGILAAFRKMARVPFVIALNRAAGIEPADEERVRAVLELSDQVPVVPCDATDRESVKSVLLSLLYTVVDTLGTPAAETVVVKPVAEVGDDPVAQDFDEVVDRDVPDPATARA
jgi:small GTP-binding protein